MKKTLFLTGLVMALFMSSCIIDSSSWNNAVSGKGNVVKEERNLSGFTGIHLSSGIDVYLSEGDFEVVVEADENLHEVIETRLEGRVLEVGTDRVNIRNAKAKRVHISLPELKKLSVSSAGDLEGMNLFHCDDLDVNVSSAGDLLLEVEAGDIYLNISSSGDAKLAGKADRLDVTLSSAGDLDAFDLQARRVDVNVSSAGDARVFATEEISMTSSSAGSIYYRGDAEVVHKSKSSAGSIVKK